MTELMPPVALSGVNDGSVARKSGVTSHLVLLNVLFLNGVTRHGPVHAYVCVACPFGLNAFEYRSPIVSPKMPYDVLTTVLPVPVTSQATPTRGTVSIHVSTSCRGYVLAGKIALNWPASFVCSG